MQPNNQVTPQNIVNTLDARFGTKPLLQHFAAKGLNAAKRAKTAIATQNPYAVGVEAENMAEALQTIYDILHRENPDTLPPDDSKG